MEVTTQSIKHSHAISNLAFNFKMSNYEEIIIYHIVAGTLFSWLPLTQGLYISHMTTQPECMVFQMAECLVIGLGVVVMLKNKQEDIILRKWKAENI